MTLRFSVDNWTIAELRKAVHKDLDAGATREDVQAKWAPARSNERRLYTLLVETIVDQWMEDRCLT